MRCGLQFGKNSLILIPPVHNNTLELVYFLNNLGDLRKSSRERKIIYFLLASLLYIKSSTNIYTLKERVNSIKNLESRIAIWHQLKLIIKLKIKLSERKFIKFSKGTY